jgi:hypothetical protein
MRYPSLLVIALAAAACTPPAELPTPSISTPSGYSTSLGSQADSGSGLAVPNRGAAQADLVVRPDTIMQGFALKETEPDPQKAVAAAQAAAADMTKRLQQATNGTATIKMCGITISPTTRAKDSGVENVFTVVVDGSIEVRLTPDLDYWARSRLLASLSQATKEIADATRAVKDGSRGSSFDQMRPLVKDAEAFRPKLTERWIQRARAFADAAQAQPAPLYLSDCAPPGQIEQKVISLEEIGLSLAVTCKIDVLRSGKDRGAP